MPPCVVVTGIPPLPAKTTFLNFTGCIIQMQHGVRISDVQPRVVCLSCPFVPVAFCSPLLTCAACRAQRHCLLAISNPFPSANNARLVHTSLKQTRDRFSRSRRPPANSLPCVCNGLLPPPPLLIPPMEVYLSNGCALSALQRASAFSQSVYFVAHVASF